MERRIEDVQYCERLFQSFYDIGSTSQGGVTRLAAGFVKHRAIFCQFGTIFAKPLDKRPKKC